MKLPREAIIEFQDLYKCKFGVALSYEEARVHADNLLKLLSLVTCPRKNEYGKITTTQGK